MAVKTHILREGLLSDEDLQLKSAASTGHVIFCIFDAINALFQSERKN